MRMDKDEEEEGEDNEPDEGPNHMQLRGPRRR